MFEGNCLGDPETWGYSRAETPHQFAERYRELVRVVRSLEMLAGFCYTQFADTYQEANGLLYADRTPKVELDVIAEATRGALTSHAHVEESVESQRQEGPRREGTARERTRD